MCVLYWVTFQPLSVLISYSAVVTALDPILTVGMLAIGPGASWVLFLPGHQHRSTGVRSQDRSSQAPVPAVGATEAVYTLA